MYRKNETFNKFTIAGAAIALNLVYSYEVTQMKNQIRYSNQIERCLDLFGIPFNRILIINLTKLLTYLIFSGLLSPIFLFLSGTAACGHFLLLTLDTVHNLEKFAQKEIYSLSESTQIIKEVLFRLFLCYAILNIYYIRKRIISVE